MEAAKDAVRKFTGRTGHSTEVEERVSPAVTSETIKPTRHEEQTQAVDREIHQDHYHTTVQPLHDREVLPEKHTHNMAPAQERVFHHGDEAETKKRLLGESSKFQDTSTTHATEHSQSTAPTQQGEHFHHHVHETVQPVIHKETIKPEVVHTTVPVHELHHAQAQHHATSTLPGKSLSEFEQQSAGADSVHRERYDGMPKPYNQNMQSESTGTNTNLGGNTSGRYEGSGTTAGSGTGVGSGTGARTGVGSGIGSGAGTGTETRTATGVGSRTGAGVDSRVDSEIGSGTGTRDGIGMDSDSRLRTGNTTGTERGIDSDSGVRSGTGAAVGSGIGSGTGTRSGTGIGSGNDTTTSNIQKSVRDNDSTGLTDQRNTGSGFGQSDTDRTRNITGTESSDTSGGHKFSLMDKLNPKVDTTGDGKPGFLK